MPVCIADTRLCRCTADLGTSLAMFVTRPLAFITRLAGDLAFRAALQAAALTSALYAFSQLLPEERTLGLADGDFVFDQGSCTQKTSDSIVYK